MPDKPESSKASNSLETHIIPRIISTEAEAQQSSPEYPALSNTILLGQIRLQREHMT